MLVPYFILGTLGYFIKLSLSPYALRQVNFSFSSFFDGFIYPWHNPVIYLWFLPTLLIVYALLFFLKDIKQNGIMMLLIVVFMLLNVLSPFHPPFYSPGTVQRGISTFTNSEFLNISGIIHYLLYFALGFYFFKLKDKFEFLNSIVFLLLSGIAIVMLNIYSSRNGFGPWWIHYKFEDLLLAIIGILFSLSLGHFLSKPFFTGLRIYDGLYFCIYLLSWFIITGVKIGYKKNVYGQGICILITMILVLTIPLLARKYVKHDFLKTVIGLS